jgi:2',3'-cyclic-nucleotide 2'-phosphodiesterase (5'-nucleotidase family)
VIEEIKKSGVDVLVVDAGNLLFSPRVPRSLSAPQQKELLLRAQLIVDAFNLMGCEAVGVGEDELRLGVRDFKKLKKKAAFPFVSANVVRKNGRQIADPSIIKEAGGLKWAIFSLMSADTSLKGQDRDWEVLDPVTQGREMVKELRDKADLIILLAAMPLQELRDFLSQVPGVTIAVVGNHPSGLRKPLHVGETVVVSSSAYGRYLGILTLFLRDPTAPFVDEARIMQLEKELAGVEGEIERGASGSFTELKQKIEAELEDLNQGNIYRNELIRLSTRFQEDQEVKELVKEYSAQMQELRKGCSGK